MTRAFTVIAAAVLAALPVSAETVPPGTYRVALCASLWERGDTTKIIASAVVVFFSDSTANAGDFRWDYARLGIAGAYVSSSALQKACFRVTRPRGLFGLTTAMRTEVQRTSAGDVAMHVYDGVDVVLALVWKDSSQFTAGEARQTEAIPETRERLYSTSSRTRTEGYFTATLEGPPDMKQCVPT